MGVPGDKPVITVVDSRAGTTVVLTGEFGWAKSPLGGNTAKAIVTHHLDGNDVLATRVYRRFMHRVVTGWPADKPWHLTSFDIAQVLADIKEAEEGMSAIRQAVDRERAPVVSEGGRSEVDGSILPAIEQKG